MKVNGSTIKWMAKVNSLGLMVHFTMVIMSMVKNMVMDNNFLNAEIFIKVNGSTIK